MSKDTVNADIKQQELHQVNRQALHDAVKLLGVPDWEGLKSIHVEDGVVTATFFIGGIAVFSPDGTTLTDSVPTYSVSQTIKEMER